MCLKYVGSDVVSDLDNPDTTRLAIANIRQVMLITNHSKLSP